MKKVFLKSSKSVSVLVACMLMFFTVSPLTALAAAPTIVGATSQLTNDPPNIFVTFSEGVYSNSGATLPINPADFSLTFVSNGGTATGATLDSITRINGSPMTAGDFRALFVITVDQPSSGVETIEIKPANGTAVYNSAGEAMAVDQTTGPVMLPDLVAPGAPTITTFGESRGGTNYINLANESAVPIRAVLDDVTELGFGSVHIHATDSNEPANESSLDPLTDFFHYADDHFQDDGDVDLSSFIDGPVSLVLSQVDSSFNESEPSETVMAVKDTVAPTTPVAAPAGSSSTAGQTVSVSVSSSDLHAYTIYYTVDGTTPTCDVGTEYTDPVSISSPSAATVTLKAISCDAAGNPSEISSDDFIFTQAATGGGSGSGGSSSGGSSRRIASLPSVASPRAQQVISNLQSAQLFQRALVSQPLVLGETSSMVFDLQQFLNSHGFVVSAHGPGSVGMETKVFGPATRAAIIKFQLANQIVQSPTESGAGLVGPKTRAKIQWISLVDQVAQLRAIIDLKQ